MNPVFRTAALVAAISSSLANAAAAAVDATELDTVQVTTTRIERPLDETLAAVTVLDRADIEAAQAPDLIDLLGRQAGIDVARTGGAGGGSALFMRGGNSNHTLVLVDGIRVNSTGQGVFDFAHLPLEQIERIEIVRGPRASIWGADALAGVIQIFTRDPDQASARVYAGSYGRYGANASGGVSGEHGAFGGTIGYEDVEGFSATNPDNVFAYDPDDDGYRNRNLSLRGHTDLGSQTLSFAAIGTRGRVEFDQGVTDADNTSAGLTLVGDLGEHWSHSLVIGHAREDLDTASSWSNTFRSRRTSLDWLNAVRTGGEGTLRFGLNWQEEDGASTDPFGLLWDESRHSSAVFAGYGTRVGAHLFDVSVRHDDSSQFGGASTGNAAWGWDINELAQLRLSWGEGFRAPNFNELYYPDGGFGFAGNPDLDPERSHSWEAGLELRPAPGHQLGLSVWSSRVQDLIAFAAPGTNNAININRAELEGIELDYRFDRGGWTAGGNASWLDAVDAATDQPLLRRAERKAHGDVGYRWSNGVELGLDADYVSARPDYGADLDAFALVHLRMAWTFAPQWRLEARVENLGDRDYAWVYGYNTPGRSALVSLVWNSVR